MSEHPDHDFPGTFYFNGAPMPRWSQCWANCGVLDFMRSSLRDQIGHITYDHYWLLECRIDHAGCVESEDPLRFQALAAQLLYILLTEEAAVLKSLTTFASTQNVPPQEIYAGIRDGLFQMLESAAHEHLAFWTTGHESDRLHLIDTIRRHRLPPTDPNYIEAPHVLKQQSHAILHYSLLRKKMIALIHTSLPKPLRTQIHNLPTPLINRKVP